MNRYLQSSAIMLLTGGLLFTACHKEYFELDRLSQEAELQSRLVGPLIYGSMGLGDLVQNFDSAGVTELDDEGLIYVVYRDTVFSVRADTLVEIPDKVYTEYYLETDIDVPIWLGSDVGDTTSFFKTEVFSFELGGNDRVDSVLIKGGEIVIDVMSTFKHTGILTISSSQIFDIQRDTFTTVFEISDPTGGFADQQVFPSEGYSLQTTEINDVGYVRLNFRLDLINSGSPVLPGEQCEIIANFNNLDFYNVFGFIDSRDLVSDSGTFEIPLYEENPDLANIILADPRLNIYTSSSVGIPIEIEMDKFEATSSIDGSRVELVFTEGHPFQISAPGLDEVGQKAESEIFINNTTSNIDELLAAAPSEIAYSISARTASGGLRDQHFVLDTSELDLAVEIEVPLDLEASGFSLRDTFDFNLFEEDFDVSAIRQVELTLNTTNEWPVQLEVQLYLMDSTYMVLDSLFDERAILLEASQVDTDGKLIAASGESSTITLTTDEIEKLPDVRLARMVATIFTSGGGGTFVKFYSQYQLAYKLSVLADVTINTQEQ